MNTRYYRPTWAEVNLGNLGYNFRQIKKHLNPETLVMVTVKADAYGHGLLPVAKRLVREGVDFLGVASIDEGIKLRESGIIKPILILGIILKEDIAPVFKYNLTPTVCDLDLARALNNKAKSLGRSINIHIKVDTGMGRIGVLHQDAFVLVRKISAFKHLNLEGLFTHFAFADVDQDFTLHQARLLEGLVNKLKQEGIHIALIHAANSMGVIDCKNAHFNMVRPGLVIYGLYPKQNLKIHLKPVLSLKTRVVYAKNVPAGYGVSYGHAYITKKSSKIVTLPIGYGDGYPRNLSNIAPVLIRGRRFKVSGRICMDQIMVDVGRVPVGVGEEVVLIGKQLRNTVSAEELASKSGTIPYEIACGLGSRIPRVYID
jgi:alanine racemase